MGVWLKGKISKINSWFCLQDPFKVLFSLAAIPQIAGVGAVKCSLTDMEYDGVYSLLV